MKKFVTSAALVASVATISSGAFAEEKKAGIYLEQGLFSYSSGSTTVGEEDAVETTEYAPMPNNLEIGVTLWDKVNVYLYPTQEKSPVSLGYLLLPNLELGVAIGLESVKEGDNDATTASNYGFSAMYNLELPMGALETTAFYAMSASTTPSETEGEDATEVAGTGMGIDLALVVPLMDNVSYVGGLSYTMTAATATLGSTDTETTGTSLDISLAGLRVTL